MTIQALKKTIKEQEATILALRGANALLSAKLAVRRKRATKRKGV